MRFKASWIKIFLSRKLFEFLRCNMVTMLFWLQCFVGDCSSDTECFIVLLYQGERYMFIVYRLHLFHFFFLQFLLTHFNIYLCVACWNRHYVSDCKNMISMIPEFVLLCQIWFRNKNMLWHFLPFLNAEMAQVVEIFLHGRRGPIYLAYSRPWLLMSWWLKESGHQQPQYWPS